MFNNLKKAAAVFVSAAVLSVPAADMFAVNISSADLQRPQGRYLNEALYEAGGRQYLESRDKWVEFISVYSLYGYYNAPFSTGLYAASPYGDRWQFDTDAHAQLVTKDGGSAAEGCMTSTGFVWHALSAGLSVNGGIGFNETCTWVPNVNYFNDQGFSRSSWRGANGGRWYNYLTDFNVCYYEFSTKEEMLSSGKLQKGDIIWTVDGAVGTGMNGLSIPADNHHVGIYFGDGKSDLWWQSGPTQGNGVFTGAKNSVNPIYGCAVNNTYVVIPFARQGATQPVTQPATQPATVPATTPATTPATAPPATAPPATAPAVPPVTTPVNTQAAVPPSTAPVTTAQVQQHATVPPFTAKNNEGWGLSTTPPAPVTTAAPAPSWGVGGVVVVATSPAQVTPVQTGVQGWGPGGELYTIPLHTAPPVTTVTTTTTAVPVTTTTEAPVIPTTEPPVTTVTEAPPVIATTEAVATAEPTAAPTEAPVVTTEAPATQPATAAPVTEPPTAAPTAPPATVPVTAAPATTPVTTATTYSYGDMHNENGVYFNEALKTAGNDTAAVTPYQWQSFLNEYSQTDYYTATPYTLSIYSASPKGDNWQYKELSSPADYGLTSDKGGMESMGFVWHALANAISKNTGESITTTGQSVPLLGSFNSLNLSRKCWNDSGWYNFISKYNVHYYEFADKASMLSSGKLHKGDIIWTIDSQGGIGYNGLLKIASHHIGIYMGDGSSDLWWSTGPTKGNGDFSEVKNSITPVYGMAQTNSYLVIPFAKIDSSYVAPPEPAGKTGDVSGDGLVDSADASLILDDYAKASTSGQHLLSADKLKLSDVNGDGMTDSTDASAILDYYSYTSTGGTLSIAEYLKQH